MHRKIKQYIDKYTALGYGEDHLLFAAHAAFPTGVTPHLLYQLWANFSVIPGREEGLDPIVVSDFLLSNLCRETSLGIFEINGRIRTELLTILEEDSRFGPKRKKELAYFLYQYIQKGAQDADFEIFREAQYWTALSVIAPQKAASEIGQILSEKIQASDEGEILRISSLLEQIGQENQNLDNLVHYAQGLKDGLLDRPQAAAQAFSKVMVIGPDDPDQDRFALKIPLLPSVINPSTTFQQAPTAAEREASARIAEASTQLYLSDIPGLKRIPEVVKELKDLRELVVNNSDLEEIPTFLKEMESLEVVMLAHNQIKHLPATFPRGLKYLDLRHNQLTSVDREVLLLENLETLNLSNNQLSLMPDSLLDVSENLRVMETEENPWLNLPTDFFFPSSMEWVLENWQTIEEQVETIKLLDIGGQQGELLLDVQDEFRDWASAGMLEVSSRMIQHRFGLFAGRGYLGEPTFPGFPVLYLTGENFELINDSQGAEVSVLQPEALVQLWQPFKAFANLIILNVGESLSYAQALVNAGFKSVIAADFSLSKAQRYNFQNQFFQALQRGDNLRAAYDIAATGGPQMKGDFAQQTKSQQSNIYSEGPDLSIELNAWRIIENMDGPQTDWGWKLPDLESLLASQKAAIRELLAKDQATKAINLLNSILSDKAELQSEIVLQQSRLSSLESDIRQGVISDDNANVRKNQILSGILSILDEISIGDLDFKKVLGRQKNNSNLSLSSPQVFSLYTTIAANDLLNAAENLYKYAQEMEEPLAKQAEQIYDELLYLERNRLEMDFETYQKESSSLLDGLMVTINELWRDRPVEKTVPFDLLNYFSTRAQNLLEAGQIKQALDYLLNSLQQASTLMEDTVKISARYYLLEAAQYQENIDYKSVLDQLNSTTRYLQNIIQSESLTLQTNFVQDELERVEQALKHLSRKGKSKKFNIRDDGDYQELDAARDLLRRFS